MANLKKSNASINLLTVSDRIFLIFNNLFLSFVFLVVTYPLIYILSCSFSSTSAILEGKVWLFPVDVTLIAYEAIFESKYIMTGYLNTIIYTSIGTVINVIMTILAAYPLSRKDFKARNVILFFFTFTMFFSGGLIPSYILINKLGLQNTLWVMVLPGALSVWNTIITRTFFQSTIPDELLDAANIDGCSDFQYVTRIVLPLSGAIIAVNVLFYSVGHWNAFFNAFLYLNNKRLYPLQLVLRDILIMNEVNQNIQVSSEVLVELEKREALTMLLKYAVIIVASLPMMIIYPFVQKYFIKGVMIGSIKG